MSVTSLPRKTLTATAAELSEVSIKHLGDLLDAIQDGVLVIGDSIPYEQRQQIARELGLMDVMNERARQSLGIHKAPRSGHLQREVSHD